MTAAKRCFGSEKRGRGDTEGSAASFGRLQTDACESRLQLVTASRPNHTCAIAVTAQSMTLVLRMAQAAIRVRKSELNELLHVQVKSCGYLPSVSRDQLFPRRALSHGKM